MKIPVPWFVALALASAASAQTLAPATAQVFTQAFMDDIAASSIEEVLTGYAGTVTAARPSAAAASRKSITSRMPTGMSVTPMPPAS